MHYVKSKAFTLIEILVVVGILALLISIIVPVLGRARVHAKVTAVNAELYQIGLALEMYGIDNNNKFPPARADCNADARKHVYALPPELCNKKYLPSGQIGKIKFANIEDRFNPGCTYKYITAGTIYDYYIGTPYVQYLYIPEGFPDGIKTNLIKYGDAGKSPVSWAIFSVGPKFDIDLEQTTLPIKKGYPIKKSFWYTPTNDKGVITRIRTKKNGKHVGSFELN